MGQADRAAAGAAGAAASLAKKAPEMKKPAVAAPVPVGRDRWLPCQWKYDDGAHGLCFVCVHWATWISVGNVRCVDAGKLASQRLPSGRESPGQRQKD